MSTTKDVALTMGINQTLKIRIVADGVCVGQVIDQTGAVVAETEPLRFASDAIAAAEQLAGDK